MKILRYNGDWDKVKRKVLYKRKCYLCKSKIALYYDDIKEEKCGEIYISRIVDRLTTLYWTCPVCGEKNELSYWHVNTDKYYKAKALRNQERECNYLK